MEINHSLKLIMAPNKDNVVEWSGAIFVIKFWSVTETQNTETRTDGTTDIGDYVHSIIDVNKYLPDNMKALGMIDGLMRIAMSKSGPVPSPVKKAKPKRSPSLVDLFFPLSGVAINPITSPMLKRA